MSASPHELTYYILHLASCILHLASHLHVRRVDASVEEAHILRVAPALIVGPARRDDLMLRVDDSEIQSPAWERAKELEKPSDAHERVIVGLQKIPAVVGCREVGR